MIPKKWIKNTNQKEFSPYGDILLDESDIKHIKTVPLSVLNKLYDITLAEMGKKALEGKITIEQAQGAISFAKYMKDYFKQ